MNRSARLSPVTPRATRRAPARSAAFTLVEILVVVTIVGIAAAVVVPQLIQPGSLTIQAAARMVVADLLVVQNEAIARHDPRKMIFDVQGNSYRMTDADGQALDVPWIKREYETDFDEDPRFAGVRLDAVDFGGDDPSRGEVVFDDLGAPASGGTIELSADGYRYRVRVRPFTGRVTVALVEE